MSRDKHPSLRRLAPPAGWNEELATGFGTAQFSGQVGSRLVSETDRVRVWWLRLRPGERLGFHRHVLDYFWTCTTGGRARTNAVDGTVLMPVYTPGETKHLHFGEGDFMVHDLRNIGEEDLLFTTVEFLGGANQPIAVSDHVRG